MQFEDAARDQLTESQARRVIADIYRAHTRRLLESQSAQTFLEKWAALRKGTVAASTLAEYESTVGEFVSFLGERAKADLAFVTTTDLAGFRDTNAARLSPSSVNKKLKIIRGAFQQAWRDGLIEQNPAAKVKTLRASRDKEERRAFTLNELTPSRGG